MSLARLSVLLDGWTPSSNDAMAARNGLRLVHEFLEGLHAEPVGNSGSTPDDATADPPDRSANVPLRSPPGEEGRR